MNEYEKGIEKVKEIYRSIRPGGCRVISKGWRGCDCFLCRCDREIEDNRKRRKGDNMDKEEKSMEEITTVADAKKEKEHMEGAIATILQHFESRTGLKPGAICHGKPTRLITDKELKEEDLPTYEVKISVLL